jgi:hypothetical protein
MKIVNEASRLFFAMLALILVAMLTTPSSLTSTDAVLAKSKQSSHKTSSTKKEKVVKAKKYHKTLADLF